MEEKLLANFLFQKLKEILTRYSTTTDYGHPERKQPLLHGRKFTPTPKFLGTAEAYLVCHVGPNFQISLIYAFIGYHIISFSAVYCETLMGLRDPCLV